MVLTFGINMGKDSKTSYQVIQLAFDKNKMNNYLTLSHTKVLQ